MGIGIIFDLDGTLLDTLDDLHAAVNHTMAQFNCPPRTLEEVRQFVGNGVDQLVRLSLPGKDTDPDVDEVIAAYRSYYNAHCQERTGPYAGIPEALSALATEYPLAVVSNKPDSAVKPLCWEYFGPLYSLGERQGTPRKPAPDMVLKAMAAIGVEKCVYVGDSEVDILTAKNAGVPCLSVTWGFRDEDALRAAGAHYFCRTPHDLPQVLRSILAEAF